VLNGSFAAAPSGVQMQIRAETNNLDDFSDKISGGGSFDSSTRKILQSQSYNTRNSKSD